MDDEQTQLIEQPRNVVTIDFDSGEWIPSLEYQERQREKLNNSPYIIPFPPEIETQIIHVDFVNKRKVA